MKPVFGSRLEYKIAIQKAKMDFDASRIDEVTEYFAHKDKQFLADRTIGRAYGTVCRLSVCLSVCRLSLCL